MNRKNIKLIGCSIILMLLIITVAGPIEARQIPSGMDESSFPDAIDSYVNQHVGKSSPGVAVVVFRDDQIIFSKGYGYGDISQNKPILSDKTIFEYGSVSKIFVYIAVMQLVENGLLDLSADVRTYLPEGFLRRIQFDQPITMLDIMNHQSGFEDILTDIVVTDPRQVTGFHDVLERYQPEQVYEPGTIVAYSNYAVALAAYIVETIAQQDFDTYVEEHIFKPAGVETISLQSYMEEPPMRNTQRAKGYLPQPDSHFQEIGWSHIPLYPVGSASGTAEELARFAMTLMPQNDDGGVLFDQKETIDEMFSQTYAVGPGLTGFAHGFIEYDGVKKGLGHGGNTAGFSAQLNIVPEQRFGVVVLANAASEVDLTEGITRLLLGQKSYLDIPSSGQENLPDIDLLEGSYISARRPHNGFLKLYGFLNLLKVVSTGPGTITVHLGNHSGQYEQFEPFLFEQTAANGPVFRNAFKTIYFEIKNEQVFRISGDFVPLPKGHTVTWLFVDILLAFISSLVFVVIPVLLFLIWVVRRLKRAIGKSNTLAPDLHKSEIARSRIYRGSSRMIRASGFLLIVNSLVLIVRMLMDQYRSYSEIRLQLLLNIPLAAVGILSVLISLIGWKNVETKKQRFMLISTILFFLTLIYLLIKWQFVGLV